MPNPAFSNRITPCWQPILFAALAGAMGWGIRGQYGHETGAMIAGVLTSLTLVLLFCPQIPSLSIARAVAWATVAMGIGGSMTYGQTVGLTHDGPLIGHWDALRWGMFGLAIKGGIWIGFAGIFLGMGLSEVHYRPLEMMWLMITMLGIYLVGTTLLNSPFDPGQQQLPWIYFSDSWYWEPGGDLKPRREIWGGLLLAFILLGGYAGWYRQDRLARSLAIWGILGGSIGFPGGQVLQAFQAWNPEHFAGPWWGTLHINWWNMMETIYGSLMGGILGFGLWLNRNRILPAAVDTDGCFPLRWEIGLLAIHLPMLLAVEFLSLRPIDALYDLSLGMALIPIVAISGGRWWPYWQMLPLTAIPIIGKTIRELVYRSDSIDPLFGWLGYGIVPLGITIALALWSGWQPRRQRQAGTTLALCLIVTTWVYFGLNWAIFQFPWPWETWTNRTANGLIFAVAAFLLTILGLRTFWAHACTEEPEAVQQLDQQQSTPST